MILVFNDSDGYGNRGEGMEGHLWLLNMTLCLFRWESEWHFMITDGPFPREKPCLDREWTYGRGNCFREHSRFLGYGERVLTPQLALCDYIDIYAPFDRIGLNSYWLPTVDLHYILRSRQLKLTVCTTARTVLLQFARCLLDTCIYEARNKPDGVADPQSWWCLES